MTIECYFSHCKFHSVHTDPDDGPFCHEPDCRATSEELLLFAAKRAVELKGFPVLHQKKGQSDDCPD